MDISVKEDARQRIEKVITEYRNDGTRSNYKMITRPEYALQGYIVAIVVTVFFGSVFTSFDTQHPLIKWFSIGGAGAAAIGICFMLYTGLSVHYKEKIWYNDNVSETHVLYMCENPALKNQIRNHLIKGYSITYSFLSANKDILLGRIAAKSQKELWEEMIKKIDPT